MIAGPNFRRPPQQPVLRDGCASASCTAEDLGTNPEDLRKILEAGGKYAAEYRIKRADGNFSAGLR